MTPDQHPGGLSERHHQVHRETSVKRRRHYRQKEPDDNRDHIPDDDGQEFSLCAPQLLALSRRRVQVLVPRVRIQEGPQQADGQEREPVHGDINALGAGVTQGLRDEPGRERKEDPREQDKQVEAQEELIDPRELLSQGGVEEPRTADRQEAGEEARLAGQACSAYCRGVPGG